MSAKAMPSETSVVDVTSVAEVPTTCTKDVEAAEFVMKPLLVTDWDVRSRLKPPRSRPAPAAMVIGLAAGIAPATPYLRMPPAMLTPAELRLFAAEERMSAPAPDLVSAVPVAELVRAPLRVAVTAGLVTVMVRPEEPRLTEPASVTLFPATTPPKVKSPLTVTALATDRAVPSLSNEVPLPMVSVPVPSGPLVTGVPVLEAPSIRPPAERFTPVVKVLSTDERARTPAPDLVSDVMLACCEIVADILSPTSASPWLTVMTGLALLNWSSASVAEPALIVGVVE